MSGATSGQFWIMKNELDILQDVSARLLRLGVPFMLTGSMAVNFYAQPRMTRDIDLVLELKTKHVNEFLAAFEPDYYVWREAVRSAVGKQGMFNLIHRESVIKVDCIVRRSEEHAAEQFKRRKEVTIRDFQTFVISKEDLILAKLSWSKDSRSAMQARDIRNLMATGWDRVYVLDWSKKLGLLEWLEECEHE
jgi:hypothetical protein